ncbi:MAG TPA: metallophosphoesterase [Terriglobales bacterium]|nr:metallophosphoesterase [Terriglobales bacterium]
MKEPLNRRSFMKIAGMSLGIGALYQVTPVFGAGAHAQEILEFMGNKNGEKPTPFSFIQMSDSHVGFNGPPDPLGTKAFERAVEMVNALPQRPDLILFTGDLIHDTEDKDIHTQRIAQFKEIAGHLRVPKIQYVPGEHDAGLDAGVLYREAFGATYYSFDHRGVHFIALDNVSRAKPEVGAEQLAWLKKDVSRFPKSAPIVVFTHRPLFDLKPDWEWFTSDGDDVMNVLAPFENVTVLYGHIHREHEHTEGTATHYASRSLIFAFPDPEQVADKKPNPFDKDHPFKNLGIRALNENKGKLAGGVLGLDDVQLSLREFSGINGIQQLSRAINL